jgi:hypothetical protein
MHVLNVAVRRPEIGNGDQHAGRRRQQLLRERPRIRDVLKHLQAETDIKPLFGLEGQKVGGNALNRRRPVRLVMSIETFVGIQSNHSR